MANTWGGVTPDDMAKWAREWMREYSKKMIADDPSMTQEMADEILVEAIGIAMDRVSVALSMGPMK